jgi:hypothetical protein
MAPNWCGRGYEKRSGGLSVIGRDGERLEVAMTYSMAMTTS